jgi:hypothetical protein
MDRRVDRDNRVGVVFGWVMDQALVWPVPVDAMLVVAQYRAGVLFTAKIRICEAARC